MKDKIDGQNRQAICEIFERAIKKIVRKSYPVILGKDNKPEYVVYPESQFDGDRVTTLPKQKTRLKTKAIDRNSIYLYLVVNDMKTRGINTAEIEKLASEVNHDLI